MPYRAFFDSDTIKLKKSSPLLPPPFLRTEIGEERPMRRHLCNQHKLRKSSVRYIINHIQPVLSLEREGKCRT
jgi:hypothetical protein